MSNVIFGKQIFPEKVAARIPVSLLFLFLDELGEVASRNVNMELNIEGNR